MIFAFTFEKVWPFGLPSTILEFPPFLTTVYVLAPAYTLFGNGVITTMCGMTLFRIGRNFTKASIISGLNVDVGSSSTKRLVRFLGGTNDYSSYYDGTIAAITDSTKFRLPDYYLKETPVEKFYIKY